MCCTCFLIPQKQKQNLPSQFQTAGLARSFSVCVVPGLNPTAIDSAQWFEAILDQTNCINIVLRHSSSRYQSSKQQHYRIIKKLSGTRRQD